MNTNLTWTSRSRLALVCCVGFLALGKARAESPAKAAGAECAAAAVVKQQIKDAEAAYSTWEAAWRKDRAQEVRVALLRQQIAALQVLDALRLTPEQCAKLLPIALEARATHRRVIAAQSEWFVEVDRSLQLFADDIAKEDLIPFRGEATTIRGNYDRKIWDMNSLLTRHPGAFKRGKESIAQEVRKLAGDALGVLAPEQQQLLDPKRNSPVATPVRLLKGDSYVASFNIIPMPYLGTVNTGNSMQNGADANAPSVGILTAVNTVGYLEKKLGQPISEPTLPPEQLEACIRDYTLVRLERDLHFRLIVSSNWSKGLRVTDRQTYALLPLAAELAGLYTAAEEAYCKHGAVLEEQLTRVRDLLAAGQPVPADLQKQMDEGQRTFNWSYWSGPDQGGAAAEDYTFRQRRSTVWALYPDKMDRLMKAEDALYSDTQKIVLWDVHGNCFLPWFPFTNPVMVGGEPETERVDPLLGAVRQMSDAQFAANLAKLTDEQVKKNTSGKKLTDAQAATMREQMRACLTEAHTATEAEFAVHKYELALRIGAKGPFGEGDDLDGHRSKEQNGNWPAIDWNDVQTKDYYGLTCKQRLDLREEFVLLPRMLPFYTKRAALFLDFQPAPAADLEKLADVLAPQKP